VKPARAYSIQLSDGTAVLSSGPTAGQTAAAGKKTPVALTSNATNKHRHCRHLHELVDKPAYLITGNKAQEKLSSLLECR
jgi:hypothetical protein